MNTRFKKHHAVIMIAVVIFFIVFIRISGFYLDKQAETRSQKMYHRNPQGIIEGDGSIVVKQGKHRALLLIHGFADSPAIFSELVDDIKEEVDSDIYVPLLPFHGRNIEALSQLNNQLILENLNQTINALNKKYSSLTIVGMSYGGALLAALVTENKIPKHAQVILYAPGFFIKTNTFFGRTESELYGLWRKYCNYQVLGCGYPAYQSADKTARSMFLKEKGLRYVVIPALLQLYQFDLAHRDAMRTIHRPYSLIIAADDNRVSYAKQKAACEANQSVCHFYPFSSGRHIIHWGANKKKFERLFIQLVNGGYDNTSQVKRV